MISAMPVNPFSFGYARGELEGARQPEPGGIARSEMRCDAISAKPGDPPRFNTGSPGRGRRGVEVDVFTAEGAEGAEEGSSG